jgi:hypothetical protein
VKNIYVAAGTLLLLGLVSALPTFTSPLPPKDKSPTTRVLSGKVMDQQDGPVPNAVVYLTNTRTRGVKTYIVGPDGTYRFPLLTPNTDYEVYAEFNGHKSDTKTVSQFETRSQVYIDLKIGKK